MNKMGIIGCGNMGEAILSGILANKIATAKNVYVSDIDSTKLDRIKSAYKVEATFNNSLVARESDIVIIAVKPQDISSTLTDISECLGREKVLISIAAGVTIKNINSIVGNHVQVIRVMPNMPALIKMGFSALSFSKNTKASSMEIAKAIFGAIGDTVIIKEKDLDAMTAISGSGPAYFFYIIEMLIKGGVRLGLPSKIAKEAAIKTASGSAELLKRLGGDPASLRKKVTSKGGTTEAALKVFKKRGLEGIVQNGIKAAEKRAKALSKR